MAKAKSGSIKKRERLAAAQMTWAQINDFLRDATEEEALALVEEERRSKDYRPVVLARMISRWSLLHARRLRREKMTPVVSK